MERSTPCPFKLYRQFNNAERPPTFASRSSPMPIEAAQHFPSDSLQDRLARELAEEGAVPLKEIFECGEFFARARKRVRAPVIADLCCGHGLLGVYFALFERRVERVILVDRRRPASAARVVAAAQRVAPWVAAKLVFHEAPLESASALLPPGASVVAAHACGVLSDRCIEAALATRGALALLPCCYPERCCPAPASLQRALGVATAYDIHRTYQLERAGYSTHWTQIPRQVTPMNRLLIAWPDLGQAIDLPASSGYIPRQG